MRCFHIVTLFYVYLLALIFHNLPTLIRGKTERQSEFLVYFFTVFSVCECLLDVEKCDNVTSAKLAFFF